MKQLLLASLLLVSSFCVFAQQSEHIHGTKCYHDEILFNKIKKNPLLKQKMRERDEAIQKSIENSQNSKGDNETHGSFAKNNNSGNSNFTIPVVVYIVHQNGPENISDQQVLSQMNALNTYFEDYGIQFCLATTDGNTSLPGSAANPGIIRLFNSSFIDVDPDSDHESLSATSNLSNNNFLRIWVVNDILSGTVGGYSILPSGVTPEQDGIVMDYNAFGDVLTCNCTTLSSSTDLGKVLVHEVGHYLGLYHTFYEGCSGETDQNCSTEGDRVCDTPPVEFPNNGCPSPGWDTCDDSNNLPDDINNHMDYTNKDCRNQFTPGQVCRMHSQISIFRSHLVSPENHLYTGINCNGLLVAEFDVDNYSVCVGESIMFSAVPLSGANITYTWNFGDGTTAAGLTANHVFLSSLIPASVTLTVSDGENSISSIQNVYIDDCSSIQSSNGTWYFSYENGLDFSTGIPLYNNAADLNNTLSFDQTECVAVQNDENGNLLFYTNGKVLWDAQHQEVAANLGGGKSSATGAVIVPNPADTNNKFYIVTTPTGGGSFSYTEIEMISNSPTVININEPILSSNGLGQTGNGALYCGEGVTAIAGCNDNYWILTNARVDSDNRALAVYRLDNTGIHFNSSVLVSDLFQPMFNPYLSIEASPNGRKVAIGSYITSTNSLRIFDFDPITGILSNQSTINSSNIYGLAFSPNSELLYTSSESSGNIYQYDVTNINPELTEILVANQNSESSLARHGMQMGPDQKIYITRGGNQLGVIHEPNNISSLQNSNACNYSDNGPVLDNLANSGLPNMIDANQSMVFENEIVYEQISCFEFDFSASICTNTYLWDFGDPLSGTNNTSTLQSPTHTFSDVGIYTVTCTSDNGDVFTITIETGTVAEITGESTICLQNNSVASYYTVIPAGYDAQWSVTGGVILGWSSQAEVIVDWSVLPGSLNLVLTNANNGCTSTDAITITEFCEDCPCELNPSFTFSANEETCEYSFEAFSGGPSCLQNVEYAWDFGDGSDSTGELINHTYQQSGTYEVCLTVNTSTNDGGCEQDYCIEIEVICATDCDCQLDPFFEHSVNSDTCENKFDGFTGGADCLENVTYTWDLGNGVEETGQNITYIYPETGTYEVCLTVSAEGENGPCEQRFCSEIVVECQAECDCQLDPSYEFVFDEENCLFSFTGETGGSTCLLNVTYTWDFGDGTTSEGQNTIHAFPEPGVYEVCLYVYAENDKEKCEEKFCREIQVECANECECNLEPRYEFVADEEQCEYRFEGTTGAPACLMDITSYWLINGELISFGQELDYVFPESGEYEVCFVVEAELDGQKCDNKYCENIVVECNGECECSLDPLFEFEVNKDLCEYRFEGSTGAPDCLNDITSYWIINGDVVANGEQLNYVFQEPGEYEVCFVVEAELDEEKCDNKYCENIVVECTSECECSLEPHFVFAINGDLCEYRFDGTTGAPLCLTDLTVAWYVNGDIVSNDQQLDYVFPESGEYEVCFLVTAEHEGKKCEEKYCENIIVECGGGCECTLDPSITFSYNEATCEFIFSGVDGGPSCLNIVSYQWDFGDGNAGSGPSVEHVFANAGTYTVCVEIIAENGWIGCIEQVCIEVNAGDCGSPVSEICPGNRINANWYFGEHAGVNFNSSPPLAQTDGALNNPLRPSATISDESGNLLFYTDGRSVYNDNHLPILNGNNTLLGTGSRPQDVVIVPNPQNANQYYIFYLNDTVNSDTYYYSIVDMSSAGGQGAVEVLNENLNLLPYFDLETFEFDSKVYKHNMTVIQHEDCESFWLVVNPFHKFFAYHITASGISDPVISDAEGDHFTDGYLESNSESNGGMKATLDGSMIGYSTLFLGNTTTLAPILYLWNFDTSSGVVSANSNTDIDNFEYTGYSVEFSPSGERLYATLGESIIQYNTSDLNAGREFIYGDQWVGFNPLESTLQLGMDGKIYISRMVVSGAITSDALGVINEPDQFGSLCNLELNQLDLAGGMSHASLPQLVPCSCSSSKSKDVTESAYKTVGSIDQLAVKMYPNPADEKFIIDMSDWSDLYAVEVVNTFGQQVYTVKSDYSKCDILVKEWPSGVYYVIVKDSKGNIIGNNRMVVN